MQIKIGEGDFDFEEVEIADEMSAIWSLVSKLPRHLQEVVREMQRQDRLHVMKYDCTTGMIDLQNVNAKRKVRIAQRLFILGLSNKGKVTRKATVALRDAFVAKAGVPTILDIDGNLNERLGAYEVPVPIRKLIGIHGPKISISVYVEIQWRLWRLKLPATMRGDVLISYPHAWRFVVQANYDCKKQRRITPIEGRAVRELELLPLVPADPVARKLLEKHLAERERKIRESIQQYKKLLAQTEEGLREKPDDVTYLWIKTLDEENLRRLEADLEEIRRQRRALQED